MLVTSSADLPYKTRISFEFPSSLFHGGGSIAQGSKLPRGCSAVPSHLFQLPPTYEGSSCSFISLSVGPYATLSCSNVYAVHVFFYCWILDFILFLCKNAYHITRRAEEMSRDGGWSPLRKRHLAVVRYLLLTYLRNLICNTHGREGISD